MLRLKLKKFSQNKILNTNMEGVGFTKGRNYDTNLGRLGRMETAQRELTRVGDLRTEMRKLNTEVGNNLKNKQEWLRDTD